MKIVLQDVQTEMYYKAPGAWTREVSDAQDFASSGRAIKHIRQNQLRGVQVLVAFLEPPYVDTVALQLPDAQQLRPAA